MSVVVRMEMPQNCWVCPFGSDRFIWDENDGRPHYVMVRFCSRHSGEEFHVLETDTIDRPWYCDSFICQLPEGHGRLVDAEAMAKDLEYDCELDAIGLDDMTIVGHEREHLQFDKDCKQNCMWYLTEQETIVPAERSET